jgi:hypothetical protein
MFSGVSRCLVQLSDAGNTAQPRQKCTKQKGEKRVKIKKIIQKKKAESTEEGLELAEKAVAHRVSACFRVYYASLEDSLLSPPWPGNAQHQR